MKRREFIVTAAAPVILAATRKRHNSGLRLAAVREVIAGHLDGLLDHEGYYGSIRPAPQRRPDLYSSCDAAIMRSIMGEDFRLCLAENRRKEWIAHINSFANRYLKDGSYEDTHGHSPLHANGMVIGALGVLGGQQIYPNRLYDAFSAEERIAPWLERIDWKYQWSASHLFWGGMHCYSMSRHCTAGWREQVFDWLDAHLDPQSGWWCKGIAHADRHQPLGGSVHILPMYEHHGRAFAYPERVIDSVLALQLSDGRWLQSEDPNPMTYLELDALYALKYMKSLAPAYRKEDIRRAVNRYARTILAYWPSEQDVLLQSHPHILLGAVGTFGLLQHFEPELFQDDFTWSDIFSDLRFYRTDLVEVPA